MAAIDFYETYYAVHAYTPPIDSPAEDTTPVESLRIRTPDFSTHEEADRRYIQKRIARTVERRCWGLFYASCIVAAAYVGLHSKYRGHSRAEMEPIVAFVAYASLFTAGLTAYCACWNRRFWQSIHQEESEGKKEEDSEVDSSV